MTLEIRKEAGMTYLRELRFPIRWTPAAEKVPKQATADAAALSDLYIWPQALANSELVAIDAGPRASPKPLAQTSSAARLSFKAGLDQFVNMVQYYTIFGSKVGSHYLAMGTLGLLFGGASYTMSGGSKKPATQAPPINAASSDEADFIKKFMDEAEAEEKRTKH